MPAVHQLQVSGCLRACSSLPLRPVSWGNTGTNGRRWLPVVRLRGLATAWSSGDQAQGHRAHGEAESITDGVVVVAAIPFWSVAVDAVAYRFPRMAALLKAQPRALIENGKLNRKVMLREFMTAEKVRSQLRLHGIEDIAVVDRAYIEPNGMISVIHRDREETEPVERPEAL
ncbi:DUF421 domain-containing protein [Micromonospora phytophila]|uniref:DUF421 domain-containing protein n=1 Tax=Micromonospora phytophila TaxID=709888 RepID=UPI00202F8577|nr:YetF domain-containing protein [Micromonospora phytophila]MCM0674139.1 DUF421 domain-containing protein [Micromonospora phytophila]